MITWLVAPLTYGFMQRGMLVAVLVGVACAVVGCYVVLRSMAFIGDAMAHSILPGVAVAYLLKGNLLIGALAAAIAVAFGIGFFSRQGRLREDSAIGILFAAAFSLGVILISSIRTYALDLSHILFGNVLGVSVLDLVLTAAAQRWIAQKGYDPDFGARPLKRVLQREIADPIALELLKGTYETGDTIAVDAKPDGGLVFDNAATAEIVS